MKKTNIIISMALAATMSLFFACNAGDTTSTQPATTTTYDLLTEDGSSVIFKNTEVTSGAPTQFQLFDTTLMKILNGETFTKGWNSYRQNSLRKERGSTERTSCR